MEEKDKDGEDNNGDRDKVREDDGDKDKDKRRTGMKRMPRSSEWLHCYQHDPPVMCACSLVYHFQTKRRGDRKWMQVLGLTKSDIKVLNEGKMLLDTHIFASHKPIQKHFHLNGCQSTLLCQNSGFSAVYGRGISYYTTVKYYTLQVHGCMNT